MGGHREIRNDFQKIHYAWYYIETKKVESFPYIRRSMNEDSSN